MGKNEKEIKKWYKKWWIWLSVVIALTLVGSASLEVKNNAVINTDENIGIVQDESLEDKDIEIEQSEVKQEKVEQNEIEQSEVEQEDEFKYKNSVYKVGEDIPAGDYYLEVIDSDSGYYGVNNDANANDIYANGNITSNGFITISDGQYLELNHVGAISVDEISNMNIENGLYSSGVYRVGIDIPAGEYKVQTEDGEDFGYYETSPDMTYQDIITNGNLDEGGSAYVTINDGEILTLSRAYIEV